MKIKRLVVVCLVCSVLTVGLIIWKTQLTSKEQISGAPPYGESESDASRIDPYAWIQDWTRPDGPTKVGLQVGHWKNDELPEELSQLIGNTGASGGGKTEAEVNLVIAQETAKILEAQGILVEILPATVPPKYWADVFVAIHADGSTDRSTSGYKVAAPWRDLTGNAASLVAHIEAEYEAATDLEKDPNITRNMRGYYAFSWWRFEHAVHPMTTAAIVETGFLTSSADRKLIVDTPEVTAQAIAQGITNYLNEQQ